MSLAIGITGHRLNKIAPDAISRIEHQLSSLFMLIDAAAARGGPPDAGPMRLVSGLAEGADQIAVSVRPKSWALRAILPFPRTRYLDDFAPVHATGGIDRRAEFESALAQAQSVTELSDDEDAPRAYERAGERMLGECDLLIAVWDGKAREGRGGTEAVVASATAADIPVLWVHSERDEPPSLISARDRVTGQFRTIPASPDAIGAAVAKALGNPHERR